MLHIVWEYRVRPERTREFEDHYGPRGTWAAFFRGGPGYRGTTLLRDREDRCRYLTIDLWDDASSYGAFRRGNASEHAAIDGRCEAFTTEERCLGQYETS